MTRTRLALLAALAWLALAAPAQAVIGFSAPVDYAAGANPLSLAIGDFGRDGRLDVVAANGPAGGASEVAAFYGNGSGGLFGPWFHAAGGSGSSPNQVATGDVNRDGFLDLVVTNPTWGTQDPVGNKVALLIGKPGGGFWSPSFFPVGGAAGTLPTGLAVADFDRDGTDDAAVTLASLDKQGEGQVSVLRGRPWGAFAPARAITWSAGPRQPVTPAAGDFNRDGVPDLAFLDGLHVYLLAGATSGLFTTAAVNPYTFYKTEPPDHLAVADLNRDGALDLAVSTCGGCYFGRLIALLSGKGDGSFSRAATNVALKEWGIWATSGRRAALAVGDFDTDGYSDLAYTFPTLDKVAVYAGGPDFGFQQEPAMIQAGGRQGEMPGALAVGDFNGNRRPDLVVGHFVPSGAPWDTISMLVQ